MDNVLLVGPIAPATYLLTPTGKVKQNRYSMQGCLYKHLSVSSSYCYNIWWLSCGLVTILSSACKHVELRSCCWYVLRYVGRLVGISLSGCKKKFISERSRSSNDVHVWERCLLTMQWLWFTAYSCKKFFIISERKEICSAVMPFAYDCSFN